MRTLKPYIIRKDAKPILRGIGSLWNTQSAFWVDCFEHSFKVYLIQCLCLNDSLWELGKCIHSFLLFGTKSFYYLEGLRFLKSSGLLLV